MFNLFLAMWFVIAARNDWIRSDFVFIYTCTALRVPGDAENPIQEKNDNKLV